MESSSQKLHVLAIDDDEEDLLLLKRSLRTAGGWNLSFDGHTQTQSALDMLSNQSVDIIFLDYLLPNETGLEVLKRIRLQDTTRPIIVLTGQGDEYLAVEMIQNGANGYLSKSDISPDVLRMAIDGALRECELEREKLILEQKLKESQKMEAVGTLAGGIAHDFNNILTGILGEVELALINSDDQTTRPHLESIAKACNRMGDVIKRLLTFSRRGSTESAVVNLNDIISEVLVIIEHSLPKDITIETKLSAQPAFVRATESCLEQILLNLCTNARDAMPGGGTLRITVSVGELIADRTLRDNYVILEVSDTGSGIDPAIRERIFEPFFTTKRLGANKGTGLGLAVVWQLVEECAGVISITSPPNQGTTFQIALPCVHPKDHAPPSVPIQALPHGTETILVADDEPTLRDVLSRMLIHLGYTVLTAADGNDAITLANQYKDTIHLFILDISMPGLGGLQCAEMLGKTLPGVPVIFASGHDMVRHEEELRAAGASDLLQKPFVFAEIAERVRIALDSAKGRA